MTTRSKPFESNRLLTKILICSAIASAFPVHAALAAEQTSLTPFSFESTPGRLAKNVIPTDYTVSITPNKEKMQITGSESVALTIVSATDKIQFNSLNQVLKNVMFDGKPVNNVVSDDEQQLTTITLSEQAKAGKHHLSFEFTGKLETEPHGLFIQEYVTPDGVKSELYSSKFEATDARRMFPCWDEPAFRATYELSITAPAEWVAVANMPIAKRTVSGKLATTRFERSPKMPTYLLHVTAGNLGSISAEVEGTQLIIDAAKGQEQYGEYALNNAKQILADYNDYFGVKFPLPKLDSLAIPGGFQGGMENWGAITYNDQVLLAKPSSTMGTRQTIYSIQAHEMAHQWFGDLVTMGWWDEIWLNESFASWRAAKQTANRHPDWLWWEREDGSKEFAMDVDSKLKSHPILQHITNEQEASSSFDSGITYSKGEAVLRMLENYLGADVFRNGIRQYMKAHAYSNTNSADLWKSLSEASGQDVQALIGAWTTQAGFPLVSVQASCDAKGTRTLSLSQQRFVAGGEDPTHPQWNIPLQIRSGNAASIQTVLMTHNGQTVVAGHCDETLSVNADTVGFYRVAYDNATLQNNIKNFASIGSGDRIALLDDQWALAKSGKRDLSDFFALVSAMGTSNNQRTWAIVEQALGNLEHIERGTPDYDKFIAYARSALKPVANNLGWDAKADESPEIQRLRRHVLEDLGAWQDSETVAEAKKRFGKFVMDRKAISADDQTFILRIVAMNANADDYDKLLTIAKSSKDETEFSRYYETLMLVRDPELAKRSADLVFSDDIPKQADSLRLGLALTLSEYNPKLSWNVYSNNYAKLIAPHMPEGPTFAAQLTPEIFWNSVPLDQINGFLQSNLPKELAPFIARGMEGAHIKLAEKDLLSKQVDAFLQTKSIASK